MCVVVVVQARRRIEIVVRCRVVVTLWSHVKLELDSCRGCRHLK